MNEKNLQAVALTHTHTFTETLPLFHLKPTHCDSEPVCELFIYSTIYICFSVKVKTEDSTRSWLVLQASEYFSTTYINENTYQ